MAQFVGYLPDMTNFSLPSGIKIVFFVDNIEFATFNSNMIITQTLNKDWTIFFSDSIKVNLTICPLLRSPTSNYWDNSFNKYCDKHLFVSDH